MIEKELYVIEKLGTILKVPNKILVNSNSLVNTLDPSSGDEYQVSLLTMVFKFMFVCPKVFIDY